MTSDGSPPVKATQTSTRVLEALLEAGGATLSELVSRLDMSKSSVHNHLSTLEQLGFLRKEGQTYHIGLRYLEFGAAARERYDIYRNGRHLARQLADAAGLSASLLVLDGDRLVCLYTAPARDVSEPTFAEGAVLPLHCTAPGKAILADMPTESVSRLLADPDERAHTENTLTTIDQLDRAFEDIRAQGWAVDREEWQPGLRGVATTVTDSQGGLYGALCVTGRTDSLSGKRFEQDIPGMVISYATEIQTELAK